MCILHPYKKTTHIIFASLGHIKSYVQLYGSVLNMGALSHLVSINSVERDVASDKQKPTSG